MQLGKRISRMGVLVDLGRGWKVVLLRWSHRIVCTVEREREREREREKLGGLL